MIFNKIVFRHFVFVQRVNILSFSSMNLSTSMKKLIAEQKYQQALDVFNRNSSLVSDVAINLALKACTKLKNIEHGRTIHQHLSSETINNPFIHTSLIHLYMICGNENNAYEVFHTIKDKTAGAYGAMFKGFITNKKPEKVFELFNQMTIEPDEIILIVLFNACAQLPNDDRALKMKQKFLDQMPKLLNKSTWVLNSFLHMLMKLGDITNAEKVFARIKTKDIVTYGVIMQGFLENQMCEKTLDIFDQMPFPLNEVILIILFKTCTQLVNERTIKLGTRILKQMPKRFYQHSGVLTSTLHMLMNFGDITNAENLFNQIKIKNVIYYGAMMNGYNINYQPDKCLELFKQLQQDNIVPNEIIFTIVLGACSQIGLHPICKSIVAQIPSALLNHHKLRNTLIDMWGKVGAVDKASELFEDIQKPDIMTYTAMINAFGLNGMGYEAIDLYRRMPIDIRDEIAHICVLNACSHSGLINEAQSIFGEINVKTDKIITTMVDCMSRLFLFDEAQELINNYELSHPPNLVMYMALLSGTRNHRNLTLSKKVFDRMKHLFPNNTQALISGSVLLSNTCLSVGEYEQAEQVELNRIQQLGKKVMIGMSWTTFNNTIVQFKAHDHTHLQSTQIYDELARISTELKENGHQFSSNWITREIDDDETIESVLCGHSEKLAIAFNFIQQPIPDVIHITKNLRVCGDCHSAIKMIAKLRQRSIIIRDASRFHHFSKNGQCSCRDQF